MNVLGSETKAFVVYIFEIIYTFPDFLNMTVTICTVPPAFTLK